MNKVKRYLAAAVAVFAMILPQTGVYADDSVIGRTPDGVYPMKDTQIVMESEDIIVDIDNSIVDCTFIFHNTGEARDVLMGFPGKLREELGSDFSDDVSLTLSDFKTFINGVELPVMREKGIQPEIDMPDYSEWFTFTVPFKEGERVTVRNTYSFVPTYDSMGYIFTGYVLQTGATWKDSIGRIRVEFKLGSIKPWQIEEMSPGGFKFTGDSLIWEMKDIDPLYDLELIYNSWLYSSDYLDNPDFSEEAKRKILQKIEKYKEIKRLADNKDEEGLLSGYSKAVAEQDTVLAAYVAGFLPEGRIYDGEPVIEGIEISPRSNLFHVVCKIKSADIPGILLQVSHVEEGQTYIDHDGSSASAYVFMLPGIEYDVSVMVSDWQGRFATKEIKYTPPSGQTSGGTSDDNESGTEDSGGDADKDGADSTAGKGSEGGADGTGGEGEDAAGQKGGSDKTDDSGKTDGSDIADDSGKADGSDITDGTKKAGGTDQAGTDQTGTGQTGTDQDEADQAGTDNPASGAGRTGEAGKNGLGDKVAGPDTAGGETDNTITDTEADKAGDSGIPGGRVQDDSALEAFKSGTVRNSGEDGINIAHVRIAALALAFVCVAAGFISYIKRRI